MTFPAALSRARAAYDRGLAGLPSRYTYSVLEDVSENLGLRDRMRARPPREDGRESGTTPRSALLYRPTVGPRGAE